MNNKADITVTILVIGVFILCSLALISFFYANMRISNSFVGMSLVEQMNADIEKYTFSQSSQLKDVPEITDYGLYLEKRTEKTAWNLWGFFSKDKILFSVRYPIK